jgi:hypothetical protein
MSENNEPIFSVLSGKYPNGFVATGIPSGWQQYGTANGLAFNTYGYCNGSWCDNDYGDYKFWYITDWPCACGDPSTLISGWFFWVTGPIAFAEGSPGSPPSSGWQEWNYSADCSNNNISACGGNSQSISLTFTPV